MVVLRDGVGVPAQRDGGVGVAKPRLHGLDIHAVRQQHGRLRVAQLVVLEPHEVMLLAPLGPPVLEVVDANHGADVGAADRGLAVGHDADLGELGRLAGLPIGKVLRGDGVDGERSDTRLRLGRLNLACDGGRLAHADGAAREVNVLPHQPDDLASAHAGGEPDAHGDDVADAVDAAKGVSVSRVPALLALLAALLLFTHGFVLLHLGLVDLLQKADALLLAERAALGLLALRRRDEVAGVLGDEVVVHGLLEHVLEQRVQVVHGGAGQAVLLADGGVGLLDHLGGNGADGLVAQVRFYALESLAVLADGALGRLAGGLSRRVPRLYHVGEGCGLGLCHLRRVDGLLELVDLAALVIVLGLDLLEHLLGVGLGAAHGLLDALALRRGGAVLLDDLDGVGHADLPTLGVVALAVWPGLLPDASFSVTHFGFYLLSVLPRRFLMTITAPYWAVVN